MVRLPWLRRGEPHTLLPSRLTEKLDPREFIRIHRSTIVNARRIREVQPWFQGSHIVILHSGEKLRMSRYQRDAVERLLGKRPSAELR